MLNMKQSQSRRLLKHFRDGQKITTMESFIRFGITSLHRRLSDLRERGHVIEDCWIDLPSGKRVKQYWMNEKE
jgi:hypothetical protein